MHGRGCCRRLARVVVVLVVVPIVADSRYRSGGGRRQAASADDFEEDMPEGGRRLRQACSPRALATTAVGGSRNHVALDVSCRLCLDSGPALGCHGSCRRRRCSR